MVARGVGVGEREKWEKGSRRYKLPVMEGKSLCDERYSIGNTVSDTVIDLYGDGR